MCLPAFIPVLGMSNTPYHWSFTTCYGSPLSRCPPVCRVRTLFLHHLSPRESSLSISWHRLSIFSSFSQPVLFFPPHFQFNYTLERQKSPKGRLEKLNKTHIYLGVKHHLSRLTGPPRSPVWQETLGLCSLTVFESNIYWNSKVLASSVAPSDNQSRVCLQLQQL